MCLRLGISKAQEMVAFALTRAERRVAGPSNRTCARGSGSAGRGVRRGARGGGARAIGRDDLHPYGRRSAIAIHHPGSAASTTRLNVGALRVVSAGLDRGHVCVPGGRQAATSDASRGRDVANGKRPPLGSAGGSGSSGSDLACCIGCGQTWKLRACLKCRTARFCGAECNRRMWPVHKQSCKTFAAAYQAAEAAADEHSTEPATE
ncbi:hypothetical protein T492DRAFT_856684 [Pavlovales sp. CCMP2436]|nr:hypothetical protein T492DRAFT_856684 [Pavlovales sp. CCMP2436]